MRIAKVRDPKKRQELLRDISHQKCFRKALVEIGYNTNDKKVPLSRKTKNKLVSSSKIIQKLAAKPRKKRIRKRLVTQSGGFLPYLIPAVAAVVTQLIRNGNIRKNGGG